jgi:DNA-binding XRE family transcriptional regulator
MYGSFTSLFVLCSPRRLPYQEVQLRLDRNKVIRAREMLGYGIETTAEEAGVSKNSVLRAEHEEDIRPVTARKIAAALGVRVADLIGESETLKVQPPLPDFNGERRTVDTDSYMRLARSRAEWYWQQLSEAAQGGDYEGAKGLRALFNTFRAEYGDLGKNLVLDVHHRLQDMGEPTTADRLTAALEGVLDPMGEVWDALYTAATDAAETEAERDQLKKLREAPDPIAGKAREPGA